MTREEALEVIKSHPFLFASFPDDVIEALDVLIEQEPRWIPVSKRLPEINEEAYSNTLLLLLRKTKWNIDKCQIVHITTIGIYDENAISSDGVYMNTEGWILENGRILPFSDVIAWMPLPESEDKK